MMKVDSAAVDELVNIPWFENCGRVTPAGFAAPVRQLANWREVRAAAADSRWTHSEEEAQGQLTSYLHDRHRSDYVGVWNKTVREVRPQVEATAGARATVLAAEYDLGQPFVDAVKWDVLHGVMEAIYRSKNPPRFFDRLMDVYRAGHYPCGLDDDGAIVIY